MTKFDFVASDPASCLKPGKSLQVRSHCMRGRNRRPDSRRSTRESRREIQDATKAEQTRQQVVSSTDMRFRTTTSGTAPISSAKTGATCQQPMDIQLSHAALVWFGDFRIRLDGKRLLLQAFKQDICNRSMTPLDRCVNIGSVESPSLGYLFTDEAVLQSILCFHHTLRDRVAACEDGSLSHAAKFHLSKTLPLLQEKIIHMGSHGDESILYVVINLTMAAAITGDWLAVAAHMKGLHRIIQLKGGRKCLDARPILHFKLDRLDLIYGLSSGNRPFFLPSAAEWHSVTTVPYLPLPKDLFEPSPKWDRRLATLLHDFQNVALRINRYRLSHARQNPAIFQWQLSSFQSRLFLLKHELHDPVEELVRLVLLAFMTTTFKAPVRDMRYDWLAAEMEAAYRTAKNGMVSESHALHMWVLMAAAFTVTSPSKPWLREAWQKVSTEDAWLDVKKVLLQVVWIELLHDKAGERTFRQLESPEGEKSGVVNQFWT